MKKCKYCEETMLVMVGNQKVCHRITCKEKLIIENRKRHYDSQTRIRRFLTEYRKVKV